MLVRLQKYLADCGVASRRKSEEYIAEGLVSVNGETVTELGSKVDPDTDTVCFRGRKVIPDNNFIYIMLNKPAGYVSTCSDEKGRKTVLDCIPDIRERVFPVGRLDYFSEGLIILTNDGAVTNKLTHPVNGIEKKYLAVIDSGISENEIKNLEKGVVIDGYRTAPAIFHVLSNTSSRSEILCVIKEGKNRQIRKMLEAVGKHVVYLKRVAVGEIKLGNLKKGKYRKLTKEETDYLKNL